MNQITSKLRIALSVLLITMISGLPAYADDIDIYKTDNLGTSSVKPNILFILDTSGSMGDLVDSQAPYDASQNYGTCFDASKVYVVDTTQFDVVECTPAFTNKNDYDMSLVQCSSAILAFGTDETSGGYFTDRYAQWDDRANRKYWGDVATNSAGYVIECLSDNGIHGDGSSALYIDRSSSLPFTTANSSTNWENLGQEMTLVGGNYMNYLLQRSTSSGSYAKIDIMRDVIKSLVYGVSGVNVGLMRFNNESGGTVKHQVSDVLDTRNDMFATMKTWNANGWTPLSETLYEAYRYYKGQTEMFAQVTEGDATITEGGTKYYNSPVDEAISDCQRHYVILLSDGEPRHDDEADDEIESLIGGSCDGQSNNDGNGHCLDDLANYMYTTETSAYLGGGTTINNLRVSTYTVAFDVQNELMRHAGNLGSGNPRDTAPGFGYFETYDSTGLLQTLLAIIAKIKAIHTTFSSPAVSVNAFNRTTHRDDLYYTLFRPSTKPQWVGNFKRFRLDFNDQTGEPLVVDKNGIPAIDDISGFFHQDAHSYWTATADAPDGANTGKGGAASRLTNTRTVYSNISGDTNVNLTSSSNLVDEGNTSLTKSMLGIGTATDAERTQLIQFLRGIDVLDEDGDSDVTDARRRMGDPLHGQPALIQYGGPDSDPDITAYVTTNDGYLHAFDTRQNSGEELFSFIPRDLLPNARTLMQDTAGDKLYGLDGTVVPWIKDDNEDGIISGSDRVIIYFGMRRGGRNYYAMDVTDRNNPQFLWKIEGGVGDFAELGQSWSKPTVRKIKLGGQARTVLIFAAGYDEAQDNAPTRSPDTVGRGVYIVDALTGVKLWAADPTVTGFSDMRYSIPSDVAAVDPNGDGYTDMIFVGDMGGQVWRIDIDNAAGETSSTLGSIISGGRIAELADDTAEGSRRFYYSPDVALMREVAGGPYLAMVLISGDRSNPIRRDVQDRVFMLRNRPIAGAPTTYETITENSGTHELLDTTDNLIGQGTQAERDAASQSLMTSNGWFIDLNMSVGEKGLSKPLIFGGEAFYTTYIPNDSTVISNACTPQEGTGLLYHVHVANGTPVRNYDQIVSSDSENLTREDRLVTELKKSGIPPEPKIIMPDADNTALCVGTECYKKDVVGTHETLYWFEE